jgi:heat shock protein HslJ
MTELACYVTNKGGNDKTKRRWRRRKKQKKKQKQKQKWRKEEVQGKKYFKATVINDRTLTVTYTHMHKSVSARETH